MENLRKFVKEKKEQHPDLKDEIQDLFQLCEDEIEAGESPDNEIYLCQDSIEQLIEGE